MPAKEKRNNSMTTYQALREVLDVESPGNAAVEPHNLGGSWSAPSTHGAPNINDDLIITRRNNSGSGNPRDIQATLFGFEIEQGLGYSDKRVYSGEASEKSYWEDRALSGHISDALIIALFPRKKDLSRTNCPKCGIPHYETSHGYSGGNHYCSEDCFHSH
jgi:hypothetical protein